MDQQQPSRFQFKSAEMTQLICNENTAKITSLFDYQITAMVQLNNHFNKNGKNKPNPKPFLIVAPTGSGKSGMISIAPYILKSRKVLIVTPSLEITIGLRETFGDMEPKSFFEKVNFPYWKTLIGRVDIIQNSKEFLSHRQVPELVITNSHKFGGNSKLSLFIKEEEDNIQTVEKVQKALQQFSTVIVDEAHHFPANTWRKILKEFEGKQIVFLTATPFWYNKNGDKLKLDKIEDMVQHIISRDEVIGKTIRKCQFIEKEEKVVLRDVIQILNEHDNLEPNIKHKAMIHVDGINEARRSSREWNKENENGQAVTTFFTSEKNTEKNLKKFEENDDVRILFVCAKLLEGYDKHFISVCVIASKIGSEIRFNQFVGRCLRKSKIDDKVEAQVLSSKEYQQMVMWKLYQKEEFAIEKEDEDEDVNSN